jgi:hypothetical protein
VTASLLFRSIGQTREARLIKKRWVILKINLLHIEKYHFLKSTKIVSIEAHNNNTLIGIDSHLGMISIQ